MTRARILKVVPTLMCGGTEHQFMMLARLLDRGRFDLEFACLRRWGPFLQEIAERRIPLSEYRVTTFRSVRVPHRLAAIMEGESLFNDGTALVLVSLTAGVVLSGQAEPIDTMRMFLVAIGAGMLLGVIFGTLGAQVVRRAPDDLTAILASMVLVFAASLSAEVAHGSPVIAVVTAGVFGWLWPR